MSFYTHLSYRRNTYVKRTTHLVIQPHVKKNILTCIFSMTKILTRLETKNIVWFKKYIKIIKEGSYFNIHITQI